MGRQAELMIYCVTGFWGFGVLLGGIFTFKLGWGLAGLWLGITTGVLATGETIIFRNSPIAIMRRTMSQELDPLSRPGRGF